MSTEVSGETPLEERADQLTHRIEEFERAICSAPFRTACAVSESRRVDSAFHLRFARAGKGWALLVETTKAVGDEQPMSDMQRAFARFQPKVLRDETTSEPIRATSLDHRMRAVKLFPDLVRKMKETHDKRLQSMTEAEQAAIEAAAKLEELLGGAQ